MSTPTNSGLTTAALRGAVDLGALAQRRQAQDRAAGAPAAGGAAAGGSFVRDVTAATFQHDVIEQSMTVPVVLDLWADWCGPCKQLSPVLESLADEYAGRFILAKVDVDAEQQIAAAFQVQSIPSVFAVIGGQPVPLFQGALPAAQVRQFLDELLRVAAENGVSGTAVPAAAEAEQVEEPEGPSPVDAEFDRAVAAIDQGDWRAARDAYRTILAMVPDEPDAIAGLAQVDLWERTSGVDVPAALAAADADPSDVDAAIVAADILAADGDRDGAYARLVTAVRLNSGDERTRARTRLLELFELAPADDPAVAAARRALAAALY